MKLAPSEGTFTIIWAVDPYAGVPLRRTAVNAIKSLTKNRKASIEPVYLATSFLDSTPSQTSGDVASLSRSIAIEALAKTPGLAELTGLLPLTFLTDFSRSAQHQAARLIEYARTRGAGTIVVSSHARKRIEKWFLGSFTDALLEQSGLPILVVNPHWKGSSELERLVFPTDFSAASKDVFLRAIDFARSAGLPVTLFHALMLAFSPEEKLMLTHKYDYKRNIRVAITEQKAIAKSWALEATHHGVKATVFIDAQDSPSVADSILRYQKTKGGIIALSSRGNDSLPLSVGNTTRAVARGSTSAVWVLYPSAKHDSTVHRKAVGSKTSALKSAA